MTEHSFVITRYNLSPNNTEHLDELLLNCVIKQK